MYCSHQYLSIDPKKEQNSKNRKYERGYRKLLKIENWYFRFRFRILVLSASLFREYATPTNRPSLWHPRLIPIDSSKKSLPRPL